MTDLPRRHPAVHALLFFHATNDHTVTLQTVDWSFLTDEAVTEAIRHAIRPWDPRTRLP